MTPAGASAIAFSRNSSRLEFAALDINLCPKLLLRILQLLWDDKVSGARNASSEHVGMFGVQMDVVLSRFRCTIR